MTEGDLQAEQIKRLQRQVGQLQRRMNAIELHRAHWRKVQLGLMLMLTLALASIKLTASHKDGKVSWAFELAGGAGLTALTASGVFTVFQLVKKDEREDVGGGKDDSGDA